MSIPISSTWKCRRCGDTHPLKAGWHWFFLGRQRLRICHACNLIATGRDLERIVLREKKT